MASATDDAADDASRTDVYARFCKKNHEKEAQEGQRAGGVYCCEKRRGSASGAPREGALTSVGVRRGKEGARWC